LKICLSSCCFYTLSNSVKTIFCYPLLSLFIGLRFILQKSVLCLWLMLWRSTFCSLGFRIHWVHQRGAPNGCSPRALSGLLKIIHSKVFISCFLEIIILSSSHALEISILSSVHALEISILSFGVNDSLGAPEVHPMGVAPEL
jgi:hypothetical protein